MRSSASRWSSCPSCSGAQADWVAQVLRDEWRLPWCSSTPRAAWGPGGVIDPGGAAGLRRAGIVGAVRLLCGRRTQARTPAEHLPRLGWGSRCWFCRAAGEPDLVVSAGHAGNPAGRTAAVVRPVPALPGAAFGPLLLALAQVLLEGSRVAEENREFIRCPSSSPRCHARPAQDDGSRELVRACRHHRGQSVAAEVGQGARRALRDPSQPSARPWTASPATC